jgi:hypothetical protein
MKLGDIDGLGEHLDNDLDDGDHNKLRESGLADQRAKCDQDRDGSEVSQNNAKNDLNCK